MTGESKLEKTVEQAVINNMENFKNSTEPNTIGYNDLAIILAYGKTANFPEPEFNAKFITNFLNNQQGIHFNYILLAQGITDDLNILKDAELIKYKGNGIYYMPQEISTIILVNNRALRSQAFLELKNDALYYNFRKTCHSKMSKYSPGFTRALF